MDSTNKRNFSEKRSVAIVGVFHATEKTTMAYTQLIATERYPISSLKTVFHCRVT